MLGQPRDARGKLDRDEETHGPGAEKQERDHLMNGYQRTESLALTINTDLVARDHEEQSAEDTASQRDQDQDSGPQSAGDQHSGEPELRHHHNDCQVCRVFTCQQGS